MMAPSKPSITIIGTGALGSTLEQFFRKNGYLVRSTWNSGGGLVLTDESGNYETVESNIPTSDKETGDWIFITTPDDVISKMAASLSGQSVFWGKKLVVHCSGNLNTDEIQVLSQKGAKTVSMHPIQTFTKGDGSDRFKNIYISLQGETGAKERLLPVIKEMDAHPILLDKNQKRTLHIAAVMASNYLVALMYSVEKLLEEADLDQGFESLKTLMDQTIMNIFKKNPENALTGPISRGDSDSVLTHLEELKGKEQETLYKVLGLEALKIAENSGNLSMDQINKMKQLLND